MTAKPFSPAMVSALQAVARMKGDSGIAWLVLLAEDRPDDRHGPLPDNGLGEASKPAGR